MEWIKPQQGWKPFLILDQGWKDAVEKTVYFSYELLWRYFCIVFDHQGNAFIQSNLNRHWLLDRCNYGVGSSYALKARPPIQLTYKYVHSSEAGIYAFPFSSHIFPLMINISSYFKWCGKTLFRLPVSFSRNVCHTHHNFTLLISAAQRAREPDSYIPNRLVVYSGGHFRDTNW